MRLILTAATVDSEKLIEKNLVFKIYTIILKQLFF